MAHLRLGNFSTNVRNVNSGAAVESEGVINLLSCYQVIISQILDKFDIIRVCTDIVVVCCLFSPPVSESTVLRKDFRFLQEVYSQQIRGQGSSQFNSDRGGVS